MELSYYTQSLLKFIPISIIKYLADRGTSIKELPQCQDFTTIVLLAEIKSFYDQSGDYQKFKHEHELNEHLAL